MMNNKEKEDLNSLLEDIPLVLGEDAMTHTELRDLTRYITDDLSLFNYALLKLLRRDTLKLVFGKLRVRK